MTVPDGFTTLGCSVARCCCCPATVYYPPTLAVNILIPTYTYDEGGHISGSSGSSSVGFDISCVWLDCPRGSDWEGDTRCTIPDFGPPPAGPCYNADLDTCLAYVERCHGCGYALIGPRGTPGFQVDPLTGVMEAGTPSLQVNNPNDPSGPLITVYVAFAGIFCDCDTGINGNHPAIPSYIEPDTGTRCGWRGDIVLVLANGSLYNDMQLNVYYDIPTGDYPDPIDFFNPLDPFKFSCCDPFRLRFLLGTYQPFSWCGNYANNSFWPDPSEWPPHPGELFPWNFPFPCCNAATSGNCLHNCDPYVNPDCSCSDTPVSPPPGWYSGAPGCQANSYPGQAFGYVDITGDASCFLPRNYATNCLDVNKADGC